MAGACLRSVIDMEHSEPTSPHPATPAGNNLWRNKWLHRALVAVAVYVAIVTAATLQPF